MRNDYKDYSKMGDLNVHEDIATESNTEIEENSEEDVALTLMGKVISARLYVRQGPGVDYDPVTDIPEGTEVLIMNDSEDWYEVVTATGQEGFVMKKHIELTD